MYNKNVLWIDLWDLILIDLENGFRVFSNEADKFILINKSDKEYKTKVVSLNSLEMILNDEMKWKINSSPMSIYSIKYDYIWEYRDHTIAFNSKDLNLIKTFSETQNPINLFKKIVFQESKEIPFISKIAESVFTSESDFFKKYAPDYRGARAKAKVDIESKLELLLDNFTYITKTEEIADYKTIYDWEIQSLWIGYSLWFSYSSKKLVLNILLDYETPLYNSLEKKDFNWDYILNDPSLVNAITNDIQINKNVILWKFNKFRLEMVDKYNSIIYRLNQEEIFVKEKDILNKLSFTVDNLQKLDIQFNLNEWWDFFSINMFDWFKFHAKYSEYKYWKTDLMKNVSLFDKMEDLLTAKKYRSIWDIDKVVADIQVQKILQDWVSFKPKYKKIQEETITINTNELLNKIDDFSWKTDIFVKNKSRISSNYKIKSWITEVKVNTDWKKLFESQLDRSKKYADSLYKLSTLKNLHEQIQNFPVNYNNVDDIKELVWKYKLLATQLKEEYSGEWWLIMTKDVITSIISYITVTPNLSEVEENEFKNTIYENTWKLLDLIWNQLDEKWESSTIKNVVSNLSSKHSKYQFKNMRLFQVWEHCTWIIKELEDSWINISKFSFSIWNWEWKWAYFTPNDFKYFLKPLVENNVFLWQVNVFDPSCWSWNLLNFISWDNLKKVWNDINSLSLDVLKYTQWFDYDKFLNTDDVEEMNYYITNSSVITTLGNTVNYLNSNIKYDIFLANPPYINTNVSKEIARELKERWLTNVSQFWNVNMVELTYKWLADKIKLWWIGLNISSSRWISKIENKFRLHDDTYLVPLYRIWVAWDPFKEEWVELAPIQISWDDIYVYTEWEIKKSSWNAEFFVTLYTRLEKSEQWLFDNIAPTILVDKDELQSFWNFIQSEVFEKENVNWIFYNFKKYNQFSNYHVLKDINNFEEKNSWLRNQNLQSLLEKENLTKEDVLDFLKTYVNFEKYLEAKAFEDKKINKIKFIKNETQVSFQIDNTLNEFNSIHAKYIPFVKEAIKTYLNEQSLKIIIEKELWLEYNNYSFRITESSKIQNRNGKYMFKDYDVSPILKLPFPYSLQCLDNRTYNLILKNYFSNTSDEDFLKEKLSNINKLLTYFSQIEDKKDYKVISYIWKLWSSHTKDLLSLIISNKEDILNLNIENLQEIVWRFVKSNWSVNKDNLENLIIYLSQTPSLFNEIENNLNNEKFLVKISDRAIKVFNKWMILKLNSNSLKENLNKSILGLLQHIENYAKNNWVVVFDELLYDKSWEGAKYRKYANNFEILNKLWNILIEEFNSWNDYFDIVSWFKNSQSITLKEFSKIESYSKFNEFQKIDNFFDSLNYIDDDIQNIEYLIDSWFKKLWKKIDIGGLKNYLTEKWENELWEKSHYNHLEYNFFLTNIKEYLEKNHKIYPENYIKIEEILKKVKFNIQSIKIEEIKKEYLKNIEKLELNLDVLKKSNIEIIEDSIFERYLYWNKSKISDEFRLSDFKTNKFLIKLNEIVEYIVIKKEEDLEIKTLTNIKKYIKDNIWEWVLWEIKVDSFWKNYFSSLVQNFWENYENIKKDISYVWNQYLAEKVKDSMNSISLEEVWMLLDVYSNEKVDEIRDDFYYRTEFINTTISYYQNLEKKIIELKGLWDKWKDELEKLQETLDFAKFSTSNLDDVEKIVVLWYIKDNWVSNDNFELYIKNSNIPFDSLINYKTLSNTFSQKFEDFNLYWNEVASSITASLWVRSNYTKLYTNILLDIESEILKKKDYSFFKKDFVDFMDYIESISPYESEIKLSTALAKSIEAKSLLNKRNVLFQDLIEIDNVEEYIEANWLENLEEEEIVEIILQDKVFIKQLKKEQEDNIISLQEQIKNFNAEDHSNKQKMLPTFVQTKALYKFKKSLEENKDIVKLLNQSEVWTWKTFTMPFYNKILDDFYKNNSFKIFITEANLVSNTTKSLIENGISPDQIFEWKITTNTDIEDIIHFVKKWWTNLILSSATLHSYNRETIDNLSKFLKKSDKNIYLYCDEATFLKNTESWSYSWFKYLESKLKKTKKLKLINYLTATPVNNDNGDFLYLFWILNNKDVFKIAKALSKDYDLSSWKVVELYKILRNLSNLNLWKKEVQYFESAPPKYYFIPNIIYLLEYLRTWNLAVNINWTVDIPNRYWWDKPEYISFKKYYEELGIPIISISEQDFKNPSFTLNEPLSLNSSSHELAWKFIDLYKHLNIINFDRNLNSLWFDWNKSQLLKTYYSLTPSLIESYLIDNFLVELEKIQNFKKFSVNYDKVLKWRIMSIYDNFVTEWKSIMNNLILEVAENNWIDNIKWSYNVTRKVKKWFQEVEETKSFPTFEIEANLLKDSIQKNDGSLYIFENKFIDTIYQTLDIISYANYKNTLENINKLKEKWVKESMIKKEEAQANKYLDNINSVLSNFLSKSITSKTSKEDIVKYLIDFVEEYNFNWSLTTIHNTYKDNPASFVKWIVVSKNDYSYNKVTKIIEDLSKNEWFSWFNERKYLIQLLEDFNSPLVALFIDKAINKIISEWKDLWLEINVSDEDNKNIKEYILSKWNTLSWTLIKIAWENSKKEFNSFMMVNFVNTVYNLEKEIKKANPKTFFITWKDVKTSKDKLKIINDFDKLDDFWKTLISTTKAVEKWLSIFNSLKWYTTVWDENAWSLTQRLWRFRTLMKTQIKKLDEFKDKITSKELDFWNRNDIIMNNIEKLKSNTKEFFILWNKLSEWLLQKSEEKNILLQKVNATSLFKGLIDFNDDYYWLEQWVFNTESIIGSIQNIIKWEKENFFNKLKLYWNEINWKVFYDEVISNIEKNINKNIQNISLIEVVKSDFPPPEKMKSLWL